MLREACCSLDLPASGKEAAALSRVHFTCLCACDQPAAATPHTCRLFTPDVADPNYFCIVTCTLTVDQFPLLTFLLMG